MVNQPVLVLNQNYEPLNVCRARRAVVMLWQGKAEVLEKDSTTIHSATLAVELPSVIRLIYLIKRPRLQKKLSRREVFIRDGFTCQYCGKESRALTIDHVVPRHRGGEHVWENVVSACVACNQKKAGRTPEQAGMSLLRKPATPKANSYYFTFEGYRSHPEWHKYVLFEHF